MPKILVVDAQPATRDLIRLFLTREGYRVKTAADGHAALTQIKSFKPDLIVLAIMLPDISGYSVCQRIVETSAVPIIMLSEKSSSTEKVLCLELGAADYLAKPFDVQELLARIKLLLRRFDVTSDISNIINYLDLTIDLKSKKVYKKEEPISLTPREYQLLEALARHPSQVLSREELIALAWGYNYTGNSRAVDIYITRLRQKVEDDPRQPRYILTIYGFGYQFGEG
ncbi:MAG: response regulator transcription factor [Syntrophomonadaceae bacterium]|nr:response regulator transcription factor [Syntrophomonadaceae bacterium]